MIRPTVGLIGRVVRVVIVAYDRFVRTVEVDMNASKTKQKRALPPRGRKVNLRQALARTNQKFSKALAKLAK